MKKTLVSGGFLSQRATNAESISILQHYCTIYLFYVICFLFRIRSVSQYVGQYTDLSKLELELNNQGQDVTTNRIPIQLKTGAKIDTQ